MRDTILILNGPNLNLLGLREPQIYGHDTLADVEARCRSLAARFGLDVEFRQSNAEHQLIDWIHAHRVGSAGIVINAGAYTHTSIAILDALKACEVPIIECHISNVHRREAFRQHSYVSLAATAVMAGFGTHGYELAVRHLAHLHGARALSGGPGSKARESLPGRGEDEARQGNERGPHHEADEP